MFATDAIPKVPDITDAGVIFALLPGLLGYITYRRFSGKRGKMEAIETVAVALCFTLAAHALWWSLNLLPRVDEILDVVGLSACGVALGVIVAMDVSRDFSFSVLRKWGVVTTSSHENVWISAIRGQGRAPIATVELADGRSAFGIISEASGTQKDGHILLSRSSWSHVDPPVEAGTVLLCANDVKRIQFHPSP